jgi:hypothetical protein
MSMPSRFSREKAMPLAAKLLSALALLLWAPLAMAQNNLGELLDAGAKKLSTEEFKQELVQHMLAGPTATGGSLEVMYTSNGMVQGRGSYASNVVALASINGEWTIDDKGKICTSMRIGGSTPGVGGGAGVILPARCQFWFKYAEQYFLSDSDSDRSARVFRRTVKQ